MKSFDPKRFEESIIYQQGLLDTYFAEYMGKTAPAASNIPTELAA